MQHDIFALVEALRLARAELEGLRDPKRQTTAERAVRRLSPDAVPLLNRTKILTGIEALGAYVLLVLVIARAVSLLG